MKIFITLISALLAVSYGHFDEFLGKYATVQILTSCLGEEYMSDWYDSFSKAKDECYKESADTILSELPYDEIKSQNDPTGFPIGPGASSDPLATILDYQGGNQNPLAGILNIAQIMQAFQGGENQPILMLPIPYAQNPDILTNETPERRQKRAVSPTFDEEKIMKLYNAMMNRAGNFTCVVKKLNLFDESFQVNVETWMKKLSSLNLDPSLLEDMVASYEDCTQFASCMPLNRMSLEPPAVQRAKSFITCQTKQELAACVKADLMKKQAKFDQTALGKIRSSEAMDEGDKMYSLLWGEFSKGFKY